MPFYQENNKEWYAIPNNKAQIPNDTLLKKKRKIAKLYSVNEKQQCTIVWINIFGYTESTEWKIAMKNGK